MTRPLRPLVPIALAALVACQQQRSSISSDDGGLGGPWGPTSGDATGSGEDPSGASSSTTADPDSSDSAIRLDVGPEGGNDDGPPPVGCDKVDFLFVIDNSGSMEDEQDNLIASFDGFIEAIWTNVDADDYHIMVVDTDAGQGSHSVMCTNDDCMCGPAPACCQQACSGNPGFTCNGNPCDNLGSLGTECDGIMGAGKVYRHDGHLCLDEAGSRFMTEGDPELSTKFACVAEVGTYGSGSEHPMEAMLEAVGPMSQPGQCNDGYLRHNAILVVTFITDEEDVGKSPGNPNSWATDLVALKGGNPNAIVVLGLIGDNDLPAHLCAPYDAMGDGAEAGVRLREFTEAFGDRGLHGSVCSNDYTPFFADAVAIIAQTCDEFDPAG